MPKLGKYSELDPNDILIVHHLFHKIKLNLPFIIIRFMMDVACWTHKNYYVSYGMILTKIFDHFKIPFDDEESLDKIQKFNCKNIKHFRKVFTSKSTVLTYTR
jgi:hypothetical protein